VGDVQGGKPLLGKLQEEPGGGGLGGGRVGGLQLRLDQSHRVSLFEGKTHSQMTPPKGRIQRN
jgi:hypothetical protein